VLGAKVDFQRRAAKFEMGFPDLIKNNRHTWQTQNDLVPIIEPLAAENKL